MITKEYVVARINGDYAILEDENKDVNVNLEEALEQEVSVERLESVKKEEKTVQNEEDDSKKKPRKKWGKKKEKLEEDEEDITFIDL